MINNEGLCFTCNKIKHDGQLLSYCISLALGVSNNYLLLQYMNQRTVHKNSSNTSYAVLVPLYDFRTYDMPF